MRVTDDARDVRRQHEALDPICGRVFEKRASRRRLVKNRPEPLVALNYLGPGDVLVVKGVDPLAQRLIEGPEVLNDLFERGNPFRVLEGVAVGEHTERSLIWNTGRDIGKDRCRILSWHIKASLEEARDRGVVVGRPPVNVNNTGVHTSFAQFAAPSMGLPRLSGGAAALSCAQYGATQDH